MPDEPTNLAEIQVIKERTGPALQVAVPKGSSLDVTASLLPTINDLIAELTGCGSCNSGVPIDLIEKPEISSMIRVDLATMRKI